MTVPTHLLDRRIAASPSVVARGRRALALVTAAVAIGADGAERPAVKFILPVATASGVDTITRAAQPALSKALGAAGRRREPARRRRHRRHVRRWCKSAPDGYTLQHRVEQSRDLSRASTSRCRSIRSPTSRRSRSSARRRSCWSSIRKVPAKNAKELIALLKAKPGELQLRRRPATARSCTSPPRCSSTRPASRRRTFRTRAWARC